MSSIMREDFLFELGTEELPPLALPALENALRDAVQEGLQSAGIGYERIRSFATPRRLALIIDALALQQTDQILKRKGPPVKAAFDADGQPTRAATAFADSCGVSVEALSRAQEGKGEFLFFEGTKLGAATSALLPDILQSAIDALPIPKRMRWGSSEAQFVRPVHWLVMRHGDRCIESQILDTQAGLCTRGHRFHAPGEIELSSVQDYPTTLHERGRVIADFATRRAVIEQQVTTLAESLGGRALMDDALLDEVTALVEWPVAIAGEFDAKFLELPREVLISTLQAHQRYFALEANVTESSQPTLLNRFITISNIDSREPERVREGNERVVRPRLADAAFFQAQDRRHPLAHASAGLDQVTFQAQLGSIGDKVRRVESLAKEIAMATGADVAHTKRAAELCKCDLLSAMVGEFPELQGIMGAYHALNDGEPAAVVAAIREHYQPRGVHDSVPASPEAAALAIADKLDTLAGIFSIGQKPSGTKDPFALRRAAIGILRICRDRRLSLALDEWVQKAVALQPRENPSAAQEVLDYLFERLRSQYSEAGYPAELFDAVRATGSHEVIDFDQRLAATASFLKRSESEALAAANKRIANILKKSSDTDSKQAVDSTLLTLPAEKALHQALQEAEPVVAAALHNRDYAEALEHLATLRPAIDAFFADVMVNDPDPALRANRLALVSRIRQAFMGVADLSYLPG
ncbi:MAG: glycine--tRNA ligase subunit beta [Steroidobacteraceae bacterium]